MPKQRLELTWIGKDVRPKLEPRILLEDPAKSYHAPHRVTDKDIFDNMLIHGDNLLALKALEQEFTGNAFEHYDDGVEHSLWLSLMRDRLELLWKLLRDDGSLWVTLDDNEVHYFKVMADEIFGRKNFVITVAWQKRTSPDMRAAISDGHDHILVFAKNINLFKNIVNKIPKNDSQKAQFKNPDNDYRGPWTSSDYTAQGFRPNQMYMITTPSGKQYVPPAGVCWKNIESVFLKLVDDNRIWFGKDGSSMPRRKTFLSESENQTPWSWWPCTEVGHTQESKKEIKALLGGDDVFGTPKPERLIQRVLHIATNPGDLVLDSFLGSGTTAAVAHKMGRRWIGIELGEHCYTHCLARLQKVINGEDQGGITKAQNWQGGGGFRFYELAPSLIKLDPWDIPVINPAFNAEMLAEAVCKMHGYRYAPSPDWFWMHGEGHKNSHIYVTTQTLTTEILQYISDQVGEWRSLLISCPPCPEAQMERFPNLSISVMPNALLKRYEWDHDDYSLNVKNLPRAEPQPSAPAARAVKTGRGKKAQGSGQISLLDLGQGDAQ